MNNLQSIVHSHTWLLEVLIILAITLVAYLVKVVVMKVLGSRVKASKNNIDNAIVFSLHKPLTVLIWVLGILFAIEVVGEFFQEKIFEVIAPARTISIILIVVWYLLKLTGELQRNYVEDKQKKDLAIDLGTVDVVGKVARITIVVIGTMAGLQAIGFSIASLLALGGIGGVAIGFASKELISNYFGGMMIYLERPFKVGETITSSDMDIEGTVEHISWGQTIIRRYDTRTLYVPNSVFNTLAVRNLTRQTNRRIYEYVGIRYDDAHVLEAIVSDTQAMLNSHPEIDQNNSIMVNFDKFAPSSLDFFIYCFTRTVAWAEYHAVKQDVLIKIIEIIDSHGAEIAFPTSTLNLPSLLPTSNSIEDDLKDIVQSKSKVNFEKPMIAESDIKARDADSE